MANEENKIRILRMTGLISGLFTLFIAVIMIMGYIQLQTIKPLENPALNALKEIYDDDPGKEDIKEQIRALDLMSRKAFFSVRWQIEAGTYLLIAGALVFFISQRLLLSRKRVSPEEPADSYDLTGTKRKSRIYLFISSAAVMIAALIISLQMRIKLPDPLPVPEDAEQAGISNVTHMRTGEPVAAGNQQEPATDAPAEQGEAQAVIEGSREDLEEKEEGVTESRQVSEAAMPSPGIDNGINYPFFRGVGSRGIVKRTGYPVSWDGKTGENIRWKTKVNSHGYSSPVIWNDKVFLTGARGDSTEVMCYNKLSGELLWTAPATGVRGEPGTPPPTSEDTGLAAPTAATNGKAVCAIFATGNLVCLDMEGNRIWAKNMGVPDNHYGHSSSLVIHGNKLLVQYDERNKKSIMAFDINTGEKIWETIRPVAISWSSPVIAEFDGITQVILTSEPNVISYDVNTGSELWSVQCMSGEVGPSVGVNSKYVFAVNEFAVLAAIKPGENASVVWQDNEYTPEVASPAATDELVFVLTSWGAVACYDTETGDLAWDKDFDYGFYASPIIAGDKVYMLDQAGVMHIVEAGREFSLVSEAALGERAVCTPAFSEGMIFIRSEEHLYCVEE
ncbi:MAG: PQQ-binding-like beta-propeller repeat protein [Bacteroidales bacterium]|nr:PQQ-binding-like beta-propeller repeat protein [Bacteroidales bacterium]